MATVLITAYEPYEDWPANASWLTLVELTKELPKGHEITTRLYPVDFESVKQKLAADLAAGFDYALHMGQAPGVSAIMLEAVGINAAGRPRQVGEDLPPLAADGPVAYRSSLPLADWAAKLRSAGIPAQVSYHAGTFLCNAALYLSHYFAAANQLKTQATFLHLPLDPSQVSSEQGNMASLPVEKSAQAIRLILAELPGAA